jgi:Na+-transporting NADH:ubiquinone oxidoreductase subunit C
MPVDSMTKTIGVALSVSLVCSLLVSGTVVLLNRIEEENARRTRMKNMLMDLDLLHEGERVEDVMKRTRKILVHLETGKEVPEAEYGKIVNPEKFDLKTMARHPEHSKAVPANLDTAGIGRMPKYMVVYLVKEKADVVQYVLQIYGRGFYSTLYGVLSLGKDLKTVQGISFYEHAETPGLGGEIDNPQWKKKWKGKLAFDEQGNRRIGIVQGRVDISNPNAKYLIDGITGATYTSRGVNHLVQFWLGENGYGPFLKRRREEK